MNEPSFSAIPGRYRIVLELIVGAMLCIGLAIFFNWYLPYNDDEFFEYYPVACTRILNTITAPFHTTFRYSCEAGVIDFLGTGLRLRMGSLFSYIGSFSSLAYYFIWLFWRSEASVRFVGLFALFIQSLILSRLFHWNAWRIFPLLLLFFPYAMQHVVSTGYIVPHTTAVFILYVVLQKWISRLRVEWPLLAAVVVFCCIWQKVSFVWLAPAFIGILLFEIFQRQRVSQDVHFRQLALQTLVSGLFLAVLLAVWLLSPMAYKSEVRYIDGLLSGQNVDYYTLSEILSGDWMDSRIWTLIQNPLFAIEKVTSRISPTHFGKLYFFVLFLMFPAFLYLRFQTISSPSGNRVRLLFGVFLLTVFCIVANREARYMHHIMLAFPFLILGYCEAFSCIKTTVKKSTISLCLLVFVSLNSFYYLTARAYTSNRTSHQLLRNILSDKQLAENYIYFFTHHGNTGFFAQSLFGPEQQSVVLAGSPLSIDQANVIRSLSTEMRRGVVFVLDKERKLDVHELTRMFQLQRCEAMPETYRYQVYLQTSERGNICLKN